MEVTKSTFSKILPIVEAAIRRATFVAVDGEYSGLQTHKKKEYLFMDDIQQRYEKLRDSASNFALLQFGIATFTWVPSENKYDVQPFSFYLFSEPSKLMGFERRFTVQSSSFSFLAQYKYDFNKTFYEGIPYMSKSEEISFRRRRGANSSSNGDGLNDGTPIVLKEEDKTFVDGICSLVDEWLQKGLSKELDLPSCNSYERLLLYQQIRVRYNNYLTLMKRSDNQNNVYLVVLRLNEEEKKAHEKETLELAESDLQCQIGFRRVIDTLIESKKPLIAHNALLDLCHIYSKFVDRLPEDVREFKRNFGALFPCLVDTKVLAKREEFGGLIAESSLGEMFRTLQKDPFDDLGFTFSFEEGFDTYLKNESFHDGGYDAFCTGYSFAKMMHYRNRQIESKEKKLNPMDISLNGSMTLADDLTISPFLNKINMMKSDYLYFDLEGEESNPDRSSTFYIYSFPKEWKTSDLEHAVSCFGKVRVNWIDDQSAFIKFQDANSYGTKSISCHAPIAVKANEIVLPVVQLNNCQVNEEKKVVGDDNVDKQGPIEDLNGDGSAPLSNVVISSSNEFMKFLKKIRGDKENMDLVSCPGLPYSILTYQEYAQQAKNARFNNEDVLVTPILKRRKEN